MSSNQLKTKHVVHTTRNKNIEAPFLEIKTLFGRYIDGGSFAVSRPSIFPSYTFEWLNLIKA